MLRNNSVCRGPGQPSPACPLSIGDYDTVEPAEPRSVLGTVFDPPSPACPLHRGSLLAPDGGSHDRSFCRMGRSSLMVHLEVQDQRVHPYVTRLSFKPGPTPTPTVTPRPTPTTLLRHLRHSLPRPVHRRITNCSLPGTKVLLAPRHCRESANSRLRNFIRRVR